MTELLPDWTTIARPLARGPRCADCFGDGWVLESGTPYGSRLRRKCGTCGGKGEMLGLPHQSKMRPHDNKFHAGNGDDGKHYWITPPDLYASLDAEFGFDFDPCPNPLPTGFDGLTCEWGASNYVNPPFGSIMHQGKKKGPTAWVRKAIAEQAKGKRVVLVYPVDKWVLMLLAAIGTEVRNLGDVRWLSVEDGQPGKGTGRHIAAFILQPRNDTRAAPLDALRGGGNGER